MKPDTLNMFEETECGWIRLSRMSASSYTANIQSYGLIYRARSASKLKRHRPCSHCTLGLSLPSEQWFFRSRKHVRCSLVNFDRYLRRSSGKGVYTQQCNKNSIDCEVKMSRSSGKGRAAVSKGTGPSVVFKVCGRASAVNESPNASSRPSDCQSQVINGEWTI